MQDPNKRPSLKQMASHLHVSTRSLHRYLKTEKTSFKNSLDKHQALIAKECVLVHGNSVSQTASALGFVDVADFRRAFKRWYQCTPSVFLNKEQRE